MRFILALLCACCISTAHPAAAEQQRVLLIGDSLFATNALTGRSVGSYLSKYLGSRVTDRSTIGARMVYRLPLTGAMGLSIPAQYQGGPWDWVVVNGGGNDLWFGCGPDNCDRKLNQLISISGKGGAIPKLLAQAHNNGSKVLFVGYMRSPGIDTPIEHLKDEGDALEARLATLARKVPNVHFLPLTDMIPHGDLSYLAMDRIHPSPKASKEIARRIAKVILNTR